ncbi:MAG: tetratricopeptide repeat protein, partial [Prevotellaceae bacterium]|nr:tetratricopeptide repeat protein [Prevotellaceae bacterium]
AKLDYDVAMKKIAEHQSQLATSDSSMAAYADTSQKFDQLVAFDADFGNKNFTGDNLQYRRVDITILPLFRLAVGAADDQRYRYGAYFNAELEKFKQHAQAMQVSVVNGKPTRDSRQQRQLMLQCDRLIDSLGSSSLGYFAKASLLEEQNQYATSISYYKQALSIDKSNAFYHFNRSVAQSEMVDFISSIDNSAQTIALENDNSTSTKRKAQSAHSENKSYSYSEAISDLQQAIALQPDFAYAYYNLGNLQCSSSQMPEAIGSYTRAIALHPNMGEAYYNRGLVQIYLRDTEKGCLDVSKSGELGIQEAYNVIKRFCTKK